MSDLLHTDRGVHAPAFTNVIELALTLFFLILANKNERHGGKVFVCIKTAVQNLLYHE